MANKNNLIRRLVLAKKLYLHGCDYAFNKDEISRMLAIHNFDNAVEIILKCIATERNLTPSKKYFTSPELLKKLEDLPFIDQIGELHNVRNIIQHQGDIPDQDTIIKYKGYLEDFFKKITKEIFDIHYEELYLSRLIENERLREKILKAEQAFGKEQYRECIELCDEALISATFEEGDIFGIAGMLTGYWGASDELKGVISKDYAEKYKEKEYYELAKELSRAILQLGQASTGMQFLEEYRMDFLKHRELINRLDQLSGGELKTGAQYSLNFIINLLLKWQERGLIKG